MTILNELIDKQDTFEIVRDQIAAILANNVAEQKSLATAAGQDPSLYDFKTYTERSKPWGMYQKSNPETTPIVNVYFDSATAEKGASNHNQYQKHTGTFHIDCYGYGKTTSTAGGHSSGDELANLEAQRTARLAKNIIMADVNTYLDLRGLVWSRWITNVVQFQDLQDNEQMQYITAIRLTLAVEYTEYSPQQGTEVLEGVGIEINRASDGEVLAQIDTTT